MHKPVVLEIACFNIDSAIIAQEAGADRIEFCRNYKVGGLTPSFDAIKELRNKVSIPLHVMIRPREGNFVYSESELEQMKKSIEFCKLNKIEGVVFGVLTKRNEVERAICKQLLEVAKPMKSCFHRAFDSCGNLDDAMEIIIELGFDCVLSSGGEKNAILGLNSLKRLHTQFGNRISIIAGGGIRSENIGQIKKSNCTEFHSSAILDNSELADLNEIKKIKFESIAHK